MAPDGRVAIWSDANQTLLPSAVADGALVMPEPSRVIVSTRRAGVGLELWLDVGIHPNLDLVHSGEIAVHGGVRIGVPPSSAGFWPLAKGVYPLSVWTDSTSPGEVTTVAFTLPSVADPYKPWPPNPEQISPTYLHARLEDVLGRQDVTAIHTISWKDGVAEIGLPAPDGPVAEHIRQALSPLPTSVIKMRVTAL